MAKLSDIGAGHDYVKSFDHDLIVLQIETWLNSESIYIPALAIAFLATVLISNRLTENRRK